ncbi:MAG: Two-component transcriptional response regulator, LuxR family, partial [uncultured Gemmatimonadaceae bacterium]
EWAGERARGPAGPHAPHARGRRPRAHARRRSRGAQRSAWYPRGGRGGRRARGRRSVWGAPAGRGPPRPPDARARRRERGRADPRELPRGAARHPDHVRRRRRRGARAPGRRQGVSPQGRAALRATRLRPRSRSGTELGLAGGRRQARGADDARGPDATRDGRAAGARRWKEQQGDRRGARRRRRHGESACGARVREAGRLQPHRGARPRACPWTRPPTGASV